MKKALILLFGLLVIVGCKDDDDKAKPATEDQMKDNLGTFTNFEPLSDEEKALVEEVRRRMLDIPTIGCTACRYCTDGCPMHIGIPDVFKVVNTLRLYNDQFRARNFYNLILSKGSGKASDCIGCGQCEGVCPQHLPIIDLLKEAAEMWDR